MLDRLVARLLGAAVGRWPEHLRDELAREWAAELHTLRREAGVPAPVRSWRQLRFAGSLALARPPGAEPALLPWLRRAAPALSHAAWLLCAPLLAMVAAGAALVPLQLVPFGRVMYTPTTEKLFAVENSVVIAGTAVLVGVLLARRLRRRQAKPAGVATCAWATLPVIGGLLVVDQLARAGDQVRVGSWFAVIAACCLAVLLPPAAAGAAALSRRGRRGLAVAVAGVCAPAATLATTWLLVLLAPQAPAAGGPWWWFTRLYHQPSLFLMYTDSPGLLPIEVALTNLPGFSLATAVLALAHATRLAGPLPAAVPTAPAGPSERREVAEVPVVARGGWWHRTALAGAAYSVLAWAVTLTYLTPNIGVQSSWPSRANAGTPVPPAQPAGWPDWSSEELRLWMHELQLSSIVCAALCLLVAASYRGRPLLPALSGAAVLLAVNMVVVREGWTAPRLLPWLAGGGLILGVAAWWVSMRLGTSRRAPHPRRLVITITVLAAFLVPGSFFPRIYVGDRPAPPVLLLVAVGLPTILTVLAAMGVLAASRRPRRRPAWLLPAGLTVALALGGVLYYQVGAYHAGVVYYPTGANPLDPYLFLGPLLLGVPVAVWAIAAARGRPITGWRVGLHLVSVPVLLAAGYVAAMTTSMSTTVLARLALFPMEYGRTYDGVAYVPGAVALGLLLGWVAAARLDRPRPGPAGTPAPSPNGHLDLGHARVELARPRAVRTSPPRRPLR